MKDKFYLVLFVFFSNFLISDEIKIGIGSCLDQDFPQPIWQPIEEENLDYFIFLGDNVYGDSIFENLYKMKRAYSKQEKLLPDFLDQTDIFAIWDDHDYGKNDGGSDYKYKKLAENLFLDFWNVPINDVRRSREGIYFSENKVFFNRKYKLIFLDTRYFRSPLKRTDERGAPGKERYLPDNSTNKTLIGNEQWEWLSNKLDENADIRIIVSSIQIIAEGHGFEKWGNLPKEKERLYNLIDSKNIKDIIFLSGDRHAGAIYKDKTTKGTKLYEITSSSLNLPGAAWVTKYKGKDRPPEPGPNRVNSMYLWENYGFIEFTENNIHLSLKDINGKQVNFIEIN